MWCQETRCSLLVGYKQTARTGARVNQSRGTKRKRRTRNTTANGKRTNTKHRSGRKSRTNERIYTTGTANRNRPRIASQNRQKSTARNRSGRTQNPRTWKSNRRKRANKRRKWNHDKKQKNECSLSRAWQQEPKQGGFFRFVLPLFWILQMLNFASHFCFVMVEYLNVCFYFSLLVLGFWFVGLKRRYFAHFGSFRVFYNKNSIKSIIYT